MKPSFPLIFAFLVGAAAPLDFARAETAALDVADVAVPAKATAAPSDAPKAPPKEPEAGASAAPKPDAAPKATTPRQVVAQGKGLVFAMETGGFFIQRKLREARAHGDGVRVRCLDEKLTRIHVATRDGRKGLERLEADAAAANAELLRLRLLAERAGRVTSEAARCGERIGDSGAAGNEVRVAAPNLPRAEEYPLRQKRR